MAFAGVYRRTRDRLRRLAKMLDRRGGRALLGSILTVEAIVTRQPLRSVRWSRRDHRWNMRWNEGRASDTRRWRRWQDWATQGFRYDIEDLLFSQYRPTTGDVVVDVGAGHGGETFILAHLVGPTGRVIAVEAAPKTFDRLAALCDLNDWKHVVPIQAAVLDRPGNIMLSESGPWVANNVYEVGETEVAAVTLDDVCAELSITRIDWLKMNIEGAEKDAIRGMERIAPSIRHLTIACHDFLGTDWSTSRQAVVDWLLAHGFQVRRRDDPVPAFRDYIYAWR